MRRPLKSAQVAKTRGRVIRLKCPGPRSKNSQLQSGFPATDVATATNAERHRNIACSNDAGQHRTTNQLTYTCGGDLLFARWYLSSLTARYTTNTRLTHVNTAKAARVGTAALYLEPCSTMNLMSPATRAISTSPLTCIPCLVRS